MTPFFSIITRTMRGRESLLERCIASVKAQSFQNVEHVIIRDELGVGVAGAQLLMHTAEAQGKYVFVLDDDDYLTDESVLDKLRLELILQKPSFAVVRVQHNEIGLMPLTLMETPPMGHITVSNVVVTNEVWYAHRAEFTPEYAGDYSWVKSLFAAYEPIWLDLNLVTVEARRMGATEAMPA